MRRPALFEADASLLSFVVERKNLQVQDGRLPRQVPGNQIWLSRRLARSRGRSSRPQPQEDAAQDAEEEKGFLRAHAHTHTHICTHTDTHTHVKASATHS